MKRLLMIMVMLMLGSNSIAQEKLYLIFEFMKVDNTQESSYVETENFWGKIHQERVKNKSIVGWDLWQLKPGGEMQGFQYLTVTLYHDPIQMFTGDNIYQAAKKAYPNLTDDELNKKLAKAGMSRDLGVRLFLEQIDYTTPEFEMPIGMVASIDLMKVKDGHFAEYEKAESKIFKPLHQKQVDNGEKGSWGLLRIMEPKGSDTYATHITVNMYKDYAQLLNNSKEPLKLTAQEKKSVKEGLSTRDMKYVYLATLLKKIR